MCLQLPIHLARGITFFSFCLMFVWVPPPCRADLPPLSPMPPTPKHPVTDIYHGVAVTEDYRWLEDAADPTVKEWSDAQNRRTRAFLDALPARQPILERLKRLTGEFSNVYEPIKRSGGVWFVLKFEPAKGRGTIITLGSLDDTSTEKLVLDLKALDPTGRTSIGIVQPSPDGKRLAISFAKDGSEIATLHLYEVATGKELGDVIARVGLPTAHGSLSWTGDSSGFYYTRFPGENERPEADRDFYQQVYFHQVGTPVSADTYSVGKEFPRIAEISLSASADYGYHLARVSNGDGGEIAFYVLAPSGKWTQVCGFKDGVKDARFGAEEALYLQSIAGAPRGHILRVPLSDLTLSRAQEIVAQTQNAIAEFLPMASRLYVLYQAGGPSKIRVFNLRGRSLGQVPVLPVSSVDSMQPDQADTILFHNGSYTQLEQIYRYNPATGRSVKFAALAVKQNVDLSPIVVKQVFAVSRDGTKIPMHLLFRKDLRFNSANPTLLSGYGGYGITTLHPSMDFVMSDVVWLENGGVIAYTGLRGGGEYGAAWHLAGSLTKKQNVFDDFLACAQYLIAHKYTRPARLAIKGASNGGLLMGAALTQRPDLFRAVVSSVGMYDMLRFELAPNGTFNTTEFGSVQEPAQFKALYAYSPYHHVVNGTKYPAVLLLTGDNDGRVDPMNSRKMTARLQAATSSDRPILLRTSANSGHGASSLNGFFEESADSMAFLFYELGMDYRSPVPSH